MKKTSLAVLCIAALTATAGHAEIIPVFPWNVDLSLHQTVDRTVGRGQSSILEPHIYTRAGVAHSLAGTEKILMLWRPTTNSAAQPWAIDGSIYGSPSAGVARVTWDATNGTPVGSYLYSIVAQTGSVMVLLSGGKLQVQDTLAGHDYTNGPPPFWMPSDSAGSAAAVSNWVNATFLKLGAELTGWWNITNAVGGYWPEVTSNGYATPTTFTNIYDANGQAEFWAGVVSNWTASKGYTPTSAVNTLIAEATGTVWQATTGLVGATVASLGTNYDAAGTATAIGAAVSGAVVTAGYTPTGAVLKLIGNAGHLTNGGTIIQQSYSVTSNTVDSTSITVTDAAGANANAFGVYATDGTNTAGTLWNTSGNGNLVMADGYYASNAIPGAWSGVGVGASGTVYVAYTITAVTTNIAMIQGQIDGQYTKAGSIGIGALDFEPITNAAPTTGSSNNVTVSGNTITVMFSTNVTGTITGMTFSASNTTAVTTNGGMFVVTWNTNAAPVGPQGPAGTNGVDGVNGTNATVEVAWYSNGVPGSAVVITNVGTLNAASLGFIIPTGSNGPAGATGATGAPGPVTADVAWYSNGVAGGDVVVTNVGDTTNMLLGFIVPVGATGETGPTGATPTVSVAWTSNSAPGEAASVTNVGTAEAASFGFVLPQGSNGVDGVDGTTNYFALHGGTNISIRVDGTNVYIDYVAQ